MFDVATAVALEEAVSERQVFVYVVAHQAL